MILPTLWFSFPPSQPNNTITFSNIENPILIEIQQTQQPNIPSIPPHSVYISPHSVQSSQPYFYHFYSPGCGRRGDRSSSDSFRSEGIEVENPLPVFLWKPTVNGLMKDMRIDIMLEVKTVVIIVIVS